MDVRAFRGGDTQALCALWRRAFPDDPATNAPEILIRNKLGVQPDLLLVGELDGARAAEEGLRRLGCPKVNLEVRATNEQVVAFYRKLGYQVEERISMGRRL